MHLGAFTLGAALILLAACGGANDRADTVRAPSHPVATAKSAATTTPPAGTSHDLYAANGFTCEACHPCGKKSPDGHQAAWMDQTTAGFHAFAANSGIASCQGCHGAALDGVGGTVSVSCAQCHGARWTTTCTMCHGGTDGSTGAPPKTIWGKSADAVRVGAHTAHVGATHALSQAIDCVACHVKPTDALSPGHADGDTATVTFSGLATLGIATPPAWDRTQATCANTYCHGATLAGGGAKSPVWTTLDGTQRACNACHGAPPPTPHVQSADCGSCHTGYTATSVNAATHIDGKVDVAAMTCTSCHGSATTNAAPPVGTKGETATTALAVGAHQAHLAAGPVSNAIACSECHVVPTSTSHSNGTVEVTWGTLAKTGNVTPVWDRTAATCTSTYCHGATLASGGGTLTAPTWTKVDGTQAACGTCHGAPPPSPHIQNAACGSCHVGYTATSVNLATHIDGKVDVVTLTCTSCHGSATNAAPPVGTKGETATTAVAVGAHQQHLAGGTVGKAVACSECHVVPTSTSHSNGTVEVTWGTLSTTGGATPAWNRTTGMCSNVYCHGQFAGGNLLNAPSWTLVDGSQDLCGSCHGAPPAPPHVQNAACGSCHTGYTATSVNVATHIDGKVDVVAMTCTSCHGNVTRAAIAGADGNETSAPPVDSKGNTAVSARGVGVHVAHVNQATYRSAPIACSECHFNAVPTSTSHSDGTVQFAFGALAKNASWGGVTPVPAWNGTTCASTYCHGAFKNGAAATMTWTAPGALGCTSCHGDPPTANGHPNNTSCGSCHTGYTNASVNKSLHLNGALDVTLTCTSCHGTAGQTATAASPLYAAPPVDSLGAATGIRVGAHQKHMSGSAAAKTYSNGFACQTCHATVGTYTMSHSNGTSDVGFAGATPAAMAVGTYTPRSGTTAGSCASTWCHAVKNRSGTSSGGTMQTPSWSGAITACTACHGTPPSTGQHTRSQHVSAGCGACHASYSSTTVNKALHVNGVRDVGGTGTRINSWNTSTHTCSPSCHGSETW